VLRRARTLEIIESGQPKTPFMKFGDSMRIEMLDGQGAVDLRRDRADHRTPAGALSAPARALR
jgi:hypothetical protein